MAEPADAATGEVTGSDGATEGCGAESKGPAGKRLSEAQMIVAVCVTAFVALGGVAGWLGYQLVDERRAQAEHDEFLAAARQGAVNLTTVDHTTVDADIQRILDSSTGAFHEDFKQRSEPFAEVVRQARSTSEGSVTSAGVQSREGDHAEVLVVMAVKMSAADMPDGQPRSWRMRIRLERDGGVPKMSDVEFVQ